MLAAEDNRDSLELQFFLDDLAQGQTVHLGHFYIGDHKRQGRTDIPARLPAMSYEILSMAAGVEAVFEDIDPSEAAIFQLLGDGLSDKGGILGKDNPFICTAGVQPLLHLRVRNTRFRIDAGDDKFKIDQQDALVRDMDGAGTGRVAVGHGRQFFPVKGQDLGDIDAKALVAEEKFENFDLIGAAFQKNIIGQNVQLRQPQWIVRTVGFQLLAARSADSQAPSPQTVLGAEGSLNADGRIVLADSP